MARKIAHHVLLTTPRNADIAARKDTSCPILLRLEIHAMMKMMILWMTIVRQMGRVKENIRLASSLLVILVTLALKVNAFLTLVLVVATNVLR